MFDTILVPVDFSGGSARALDYARAMADRFGSQLHVLHVVADPYTQPWGAEGYGVSWPNVLEELERKAHDQLAALLSKPDADRFRLQTEVRVGAPFVEIIRYAKEHDIALIVMGTHGRGAVAHMLLGSVAEKVVRKATCPVLTARDPGQEFVRP